MHTYMHMYTHEPKLQRGTSALFIFIPCPVAKAAGGARGGSTTLATKNWASPLMRAGYRTCSHMFYDKNIKTYI